MAHRNPTDDELRDLYATTEVIAVVGASDDPEKPANRIPAYLQRQGYRVIPVNPKGGTILGSPAAASLDDIDADIDVVEVFRPAEEAPGIAKEAVVAGARALWLQTGIVSDEAADIARDEGLTVVMDACMGQMHRKLGLGPGPHEG